MNGQLIIRKIRKAQKERIVSIPIKSDLQIGDYVIIKKLEVKEV